MAMKRAAGAVLLTLVVSGCGALPEAKKTGDLVILNADRLNRELLTAEKTMSEARSGRQEVTRLETIAAEQNERFVASKRREWAVAKNETAESLFDNVRKGRPAPISPALSIPAADEALSTPQRAKVYDPVPLETTIKRIEDLTKDDSLRDRAEFAFDYAKEIWSKVQENQQQARAQAEKMQELKRS